MKRRVATSSGAVGLSKNLQAQPPPSYAPSCRRLRPSPRVSTAEGAILSSLARRARHTSEGWRSPRPGFAPAGSAFVRGLVARGVMHARSTDRTLGLSLSASRSARSLEFPSPFNAGADGVGFATSTEHPGSGCLPSEVACSVHGSSSTWQSCGFQTRVLGVQLPPAVPILAPVFTDLGNAVEARSWLVAARGGRSAGCECRYAPNFSLTQNSGN